MSKLSPFKIVAKGTPQDPSADILIYGDIGDSWNDDSVTAAAFVRDLQNIDAKTLNVHINSIGGSVRDGLAIYNALVRHPAAVNVSVEGVALSIASLIAMAGETIEMADNALMMVHAPWAAAFGNANDMREVADVLDKMAQAMATSYQTKTKKPMAEMLALLTDGQDHWYSAQEAIAAGFADKTTVAVAAQASFALDRYRNIPAAAAAFSSARSSTMTPEQIAAKAAADAAAADAAKVAADKAAADKAAEAKAAEAKAAADKAAAATSNVTPIGRTKAANEEILAFFKPFAARDGVRATLDEILVDPMITVDQARAKLLAKIGEGTTPANPAGSYVEMGESDAAKFREAASISILARAGYATVKERETLRANPYRGHKLLDLARASLHRAGVSTKGMGQMDIVAAAFTTSTSDFPVLLENVMHKALQMAYGTTPDTWTRFCAVGSVSDFRASNRYRLGSFGNLDSLNENSEFKYKTVPDGEKASITAGTKGNLINLSRQLIVNDDLNAFVGLAAGLGRAARRTIEVDVYAQLALNAGLGPTMPDTLTLFHATHANISATGVISATVIDDVRVKMQSQKDVSGNDYLDLKPAIILVPAGTYGTAVVINDSQYDPDTVANKAQMKPNLVRGLFRDVIGTPRLSGTRFYSFADPTIAPTLEVAFLDGNQEPYIELQQGFEVDGAQYKVRLDYGVAAIDYRGAVTSAGA